jgi:hypothetical protein
MSKKGRIKLIKKGRTVKYLARDQTLHDISLSGLLLSNDFVVKILGSKEGWVIDKLHLPRIFDSHTDRPHVTDINGNFMQDLIFEISNRIGAYFIFVLLQSINPDTITRISQHLLKETTVSNTGASKIISQEWVKSALLLSPVIWIERVMELFRSYGVLADPWNLKTRKGLIESNSRIRKTILKQIHSDSGYIQQKKDVSLLLKSFTSAYPKISKELGDIMKNLPLEVDGAKENIEDVEKRSLMQTTCKHEMKSIVPFSGIGRIRKCTKCGYEKRIKPHAKRNG